MVPKRKQDFPLDLFSQFTRCSSLCLLCLSRLQRWAAWVVSSLYWTGNRGPGRLTLLAQGTKCKITTGIPVPLTEPSFFFPMPSSQSKTGQYSNLTVTSLGTQLCPTLRKQFQNFQTRMKNQRARPEWGRSKNTVFLLVLVDSFLIQFFPLRSRILCLWLSSLWGTWHVLLLDLFVFIYFSSIDCYLTREDI